MVRSAWSRLRSTVAVSACPSGCVRCSGGDLLDGAVSPDDGNFDGSAEIELSKKPVIYGLGLFLWVPLSHQFSAPPVGIDRRRLFDERGVRPRPSSSRSRRSPPLAFPLPAFRLPAFLLRERACQRCRSPSVPGPRFCSAPGRKSNQAKFCFACAPSLIARTAGWVSLRSTEIA